MNEMQLALWIGVVFVFLLLAKLYWFARFLKRKEAGKREGEQEGSSK